MAPPSARRSWVRLARHSRGLRCGLTIGFLRGKVCVPARSASSISRSTVRHGAGPARFTSTPLMRNISDGYIIPSMGGAFSHGTPAHAARSPSPDASMKNRPRTACLPDLDSMSTASMTPLPEARAVGRSAITTPTAIAWNRIRAPEPVTSSSAAIL